MALTLSEIEELINSGKALPALQEFILFATTLFIGIRTGKVKELPGTQATMVAAVALQKLMDTADGRKLLGIRASNKAYNEDKLGLSSPQLEIARRLGCGEITRKQALAELEDIYNNEDKYPSRQTLERILCNLEENASSLSENLRVILMAADWNGSKDDLAKIFSSVDEREAKNN